MAYEFYMTVEGAKQGKFPGTSVSKGQQGTMPGLRWLSQVKSPRDVATGQASGKRQHQPMLVVMETGQSSPLFLQACCTNEVLKTVTLNFVRTDQKTGQEIVYYAVKLTDASVVSVKQSSGFGFDDPNSTSGGAKHSGKYDVPELDEIEFTFQTIEWEYKGGGGKGGNTIAADSWNVGSAKG